MLSQPLTVTLIVFVVLLMLNAYLAPLHVYAKGFVTIVNVVVVVVLVTWLVGLLFGAPWAKTTGPLGG